MAQNLDEISIYDRGILSEFSFRFTPRGATERAVPIIMSSPHRAFADLNRVYPGIMDNNMIKLPVMAVTRLDISPDPERYVHNPSITVKCGVVETEEVVAVGDESTNYQFTTANLPVADRIRLIASKKNDLTREQFMTVLDDGEGNLTGDVDAGGVNTIDYETGEVDVTFSTGVKDTKNVVIFYDYEDEDADYLMMQAPNPVLISYQINIWSSDRMTMNNLTKQCFMQIRNKIGYITVDLMSFGKKRFSYDFEGPSDASELSPGEGERMIRNTVSLTLRAVLFRPIENVKSVEFVDIDFYEGLDLDTAKFLESMSL